MVRESKYSKERQVILKEPFLSEQHTRRLGGSPTNVAYDYGVGTFNGVSSYIVYDKLFNKTGCSIRIGVRNPSFADGDILVDFRGTGGSAYITLAERSPLTPSPQGSGSKNYYVNAVLDASLDTTDSEYTEIVITDLDIYGFLTIGAAWDLSGDWISSGLDLFEIYNYELSQSEVSNLYH